MGIDRNAPCACGSGRKAKKCCHGAASATTIDWMAIRSHLLERLGTEAAHALDPDTWDDAVLAYAPGADLYPEDVFAGSVAPWLVSRWRPARHAPLPGGLRAGETFLERMLRKDRDLGSRERRLLEAWAREPASWWIVESASSTGISLRDVFRDRTVRLDLGPIDMQPGVILHARILDLDGEPLPVELPPFHLQPDASDRIARVRAHLQAPHPVDDAWLREHESTLRLAFLHAALGARELVEDSRHAFACIDVADIHLESVLARLTTGLEQAPETARQALDEGVLRWRPVDSATGLPQEDAAWLIRRGDLLELRALDGIDDFGPVRDAVRAQVAACEATLLEPADAVRRILDGIIPEPDPGPERALLARLIAMEREEGGDDALARALSVGGHRAGLCLPLPGSLELCAFIAMTMVGPRFIPGDDVPGDWRFGEPPAARASRLGKLSASERDALQALRDASARPWRIVEVLDSRRVRVVDETGPRYTTEPVVATLPVALDLAADDQLGGVLIVPSDGAPARFVLAFRLEEPLQDKRRVALLTEGRSFEWLDDEVCEEEYVRHFDWSDAEEVYEVDDPAAALDCLTAREGLPGDDEEGDDPLRIETWSIHRDASTGIQHAEGRFTGEVNGAVAEGELEILGRELRLATTDPEALSAWRADLARTVGPVTRLTWLRQERYFDDGPSDHD